MRRSLLFIPSNNPAMLENSLLFESDAVIYDLEDAININEKDSARILLKNFLSQTNETDIEIIVRINDIDTAFYHVDLTEIVSNNIDTIMVPKARANSLIKLDLDLTNIEQKTKMTKKIKVIPIIESAISLIEVNEIAKIARVSGLLLGGEDLASDLEIERTALGTELFYARSKVIVAAKANNIDAIDTPFTNVLDDQPLKIDSEFAKSLGMNAKACIHPNQVEIVNTIFSPTQKQIEWAEKVLLAKEEADQKNLGVFSLDGKMIDKPIILRAERIINKAKKLK